MKRPETHYAKTEDGVHIAYQVFGDGAHDLVVHFPWLSNVDACWEVPQLVTFLNGFSRYARVILFDRRGLGVSDKPSTKDLMALEKGVEDVRAVLDEVGSPRAALFGAESGGTVMAMFAASFPERVSAMGLMAPLVKGIRSPDFPWGITREEAEEWAERIRTSWGTAEFWRLNALEMGLGDIDPEDAEVWARFTRLCASPATSLAIDELENQVDIRSLLPIIQVPTLVMATTGDIRRGFASAAGPWIADQIHGARFVEIPLEHHFPMDPNDYAPFEEFLEGIREHEAIFDRVLATVLFTDIVDSTATAAAMGDSKWRALIEEHDRLARTIVSRYRGEFVRGTGDGMLATFDGPARGVMCAEAFIEAVRSLGVEVRAGLHTGEIEFGGNDLAGVAVHIGARVGSMAGPSEVWVSSTVKDLTVGSGLTFQDAGEHQLKGVPERWHLYRVVA